MNDYETDDRGYYHRAYYEKRGRKLRPLAFDSGELIIDNPESRAEREKWRNSVRTSR